MAKKPKYRIQWSQAKSELMEDFYSWVKECHTRGYSPNDMIEFLFQQGYIKGKYWREFVEKVAMKNKANGILFYECLEPLREGFIPPKTYV